MRKRKSYERDRCTLHKKHLPEFKAFIVAEPKWHVVESTGHPYEVLHAVTVLGSCKGEHYFIYRNDHNDHLTVQSDLVPYVRKFLDQRKQEKKHVG